MSSVLLYIGVSNKHGRSTNDSSGTELLHHLSGWEMRSEYYMLSDSTGLDLGLGMEYILSNGLSSPPEDERSLSPHSHASILIIWLADCHARLHTAWLIQCERGHSVTAVTSAGIHSSHTQVCTTITSMRSPSNFCQIPLHRDRWHVCSYILIIWSRKWWRNWE